MSYDFDCASLEATFDKQEYQRSLDFEFHASQFENEKNKKDFDICNFAKESVKFDFSKEVF
jgi:hypothetical protein